MNIVTIHFCTLINITQGFWLFRADTCSGLAIFNLEGTNQKRISLTFKNIFSKYYLHGM